MIECRAEKLPGPDSTWPRWSVLLQNRVGCICPDEATARFIAACVTFYEEFAANNRDPSDLDAAEKTVDAARAAFLAAREAQP